MNQREKTKVFPSLQREFEYYLKNQERLVEEYNGKVLVIKDCTVIGAYGSDQEAIEETMKHHELGTFLVQLCEPGVDSVTETFNSRVAFTNSKKICYIEPDGDGFHAFAPALKGCHVGGATVEEAKRNLDDALHLYLSSLA